MPRSLRAMLPYETLAELLDGLGNISPRRIRLSPPPGTATEQDLQRIHERSDCLFELIDGTVVEKVMGFGEGCLALDIARLLGKFLDEHDMGDLGGADTTMRLLPGMVRCPDVSFIRWERYPNRQRPTKPIPSCVPTSPLKSSARGTPQARCNASSRTTSWPV